MVLFFVGRLESNDSDDVKIFCNTTEKHRKPETLNSIFDVNIKNSMSQNKDMAMISFFKQDNSMKKINNNPNNLSTARIEDIIRENFLLGRKISEFEQKNVKKTNKLGKSNTIKIKENKTNQETTVEVTERQSADGGNIRVTTEKDANGNRIKEIQEKLDTNGNLVSTTTSTYKDNKLTEVINTDVDGNIKLHITITHDEKYGKQVTETPEKTTIEEFDYNDDGKIIKKTTTTKDRNGVERNTISEEKEYDENGNVIKSKTERKNSEGKVTSKTVTEYKRDENGKLLETVQTTPGRNIKQVTSQFDPLTGKIISSDTIIGQPKDGKINVATNLHTDYSYDNEGEIESITTKGIDNGNEYSSVTNFNKDGSIKDKTTRSYSKGQLVEAYYDGENLKNRTQGGLPTTETFYEDDGVTVEKKVVNSFDEDGVLVGVTTYDKDGKIIDEKTFGEPDGEIDTAYQKKLGDCYLLAAINSLNQSEEGRKILKENIQANTDENGNVVSYTVTLPGAQEAREDLINGTTSNPDLDKLPEDKVFVTGTYTITVEELEAAEKKGGSKYSAGDKDVLLYEIVYEKYRDEAEKTVEANNLDPKAVSHTPGLDTNLGGGHDFELNNILSSGYPDLATYILTGKDTKTYVADYKDVPICFVDEDYQMHVSDSPASGGKDKTNKDTPNNTDELDEYIEKLQEDYSDGELNEYSGTACFIVSTQDEDDPIVRSGGHALAIVGVTEDSVILSNSWDPDEKIVMSIEDFKKSVICVSLTEL